MKISNLIESLAAFKDKYGDVPVVLWDLDSGAYFSLGPENIEAQRMDDGCERLSIGLNSWEESYQEGPAERPLK